jgi:hypothetical protein
MVAWDGSCAAAAGHGLLFVMVGGMGCVLVLWASRRREKERVSGKKDFKNLLLLSLHLQGRRSCTVSFKTAPCRVFFFF